MSATISVSAIDTATRQHTFRKPLVSAARFVAQLWLRNTERRVMLALQALGHEGILADARTAGLTRR